MKKILLTLALIIFLSTTSAFAKEYTFNGGSGSGITYKTSTNQTAATVTIKSTASANQRFVVSIWSTLSRNNPSEKLGEKQIEFNTPPPRTDSFSVSGLNPNQTYYLFIHVNGSTSGDSYYQFSTDPITPYLCATCKLETSIVGSNIVAKLSGADILLRDKLKILMMKDGFVAGKPLCTGIGEPWDCATQPNKETELGGTVKWTIPTDNLLGRTAYNLRVEAESPLTIGSYYISDVKKVTTGDEAVKSTWPLKYDPDDTKASISGKIDNYQPTDFTLKLQYSLKQFSETGQALPADAHEVSAVANSDGTYTFQLINLSPNSLYFVKQIIKADNRGALEIKVNNTGFNSTTGYKAEGSKEQLDDIKKRSYTLLAPFSEKLQVVLDPDLCREFVAQKKRPEGSCDNQISDFINLMLTVLIGIAAVVLVIELIIEGYRYMVTDTPFAKVSAKGRFFEALLGLLLALSAYLILNTINPKLVSNDLNINGVSIGIQDFEIGGGASFDGKPVKVSFKQVAYPAAKAAFEKTGGNPNGVQVALILALFEQESGSGANYGKCLSTQSNMKTADYNYLNNELIPKINQAYPTKPQLVKDKVNISCSSFTSTGGAGNGGAIGYTQFMPTTWKNYREEAKTLLGHEPYPWDAGDALMMTALFLKDKGGAGTNLANQEAAACKYFGACKRSNGEPWLVSCHGTQQTYGQCVMSVKTSFEKQIAAAIAKGEIK